MQSFSTKEVRHEFAVDDVPYYLPGVTVTDLEAVAALGVLEGAEQIAAFRDLIVSRVQPQKRTFAQWLSGARSAASAVEALNIKQLSELFREWSGMGKTVGESSASPVPQ
jgi:hypothetical protein